MHSRGRVGSQMTVSETHSWPLFTTGLWPVEMLFLILRGNGKVTWSPYLHLTSKSFAILYSLFHKLLVNGTICAGWLSFRLVYVFFLCNTICTYIAYIRYQLLLYIQLSSFFLLFHFSISQISSSSSSSSSCRAASMDLPDPLSLPLSIVHCSGEVFKAISCIIKELLYIGSS